MNKFVDSNIELQTKAIVLGDAKTGKSSFIRSLHPIESTDTYKKFSTIHISSHEIEQSDSDLELKIWEYNTRNENLSKEQQQIVYAGALFCFIIFDITKRESASNAFNKWMKIKTKYLPNSFLFVLGTNFDNAIFRQVQISEVTKLCAQRDCVYLEISNEDGTNVSLVRKLITHRLNLMIKVRDSLYIKSKRILNNTRSILSEPIDEISSFELAANTMEDAEEDDEDKELKSSVVSGDGGDEDSVNGYEIHQNENYEFDKGAGVVSNKGNTINATATNNTDIMDNMVVPFFDDDIMTGSIGEILASCVGTRYWPGLGAPTNDKIEPNVLTSTHMEQKIHSVSHQLSSLIDRISYDAKSIPSIPVDNTLTGEDRTMEGDMYYTKARLEKLHTLKQLQATQECNGSTAVGLEYSANTSVQNLNIHELEHAYSIMGLTLPKHLMKAQKNNGDYPNNKELDEETRYLLSGTSLDVCNRTSDHISHIKVQLPPDGAVETIVINEYFDITSQIDTFLNKYYAGMTVLVNKMVNKSDVESTSSLSNMDVGMNTVDKMELGSEAFRTKLIDEIFDFIKQKNQTPTSGMEEFISKKSHIVLNNHHSMTTSINHEVLTSNMAGTVDTIENNPKSSFVLNEPHGNSKGSSDIASKTPTIVRVIIKVTLPNHVAIEKNIQIMEHSNRVLNSNEIILNSNINEALKQIIEEHKLSSGYRDSLLEMMTVSTVNEYKNMKKEVNSKFRTDDRTIDAEELYYMI